LEDYLPVVKNIVIFTLFAEFPERLARENRQGSEVFGFYIYLFVKGPFILTWAFPKFN